MNHQQIVNMQDTLKNNRVERALKRSGIELNEAQRDLAAANAVLSKIDADTRDELNRLAMRRQTAEIEYLGTQAVESRHRINLIDNQANESLQRAITEGMLAGKYSAEELESMERANLIVKQQRGQDLANEAAGMSNEIQQYAVNHKGLTYWTGQLSTISGIVGQVVGGVAKGAAAASIWRGKPLINVPGKATNLWTPQGMSAFGANYGFK